MQRASERFTHFLIKITALLSFCGGPMVFVDVLKPRLGVNVAFGIGIVPIALLVFGALTLDETSEGAFERFVVRTAAASALALIFIHLGGAFVLFSTPQPQDVGLHITGFIIGILTSIGYIYLAQQRLSATAMQKLQ